MHKQLETEQACTADVSQGRFTLEANAFPCRMLSARTLPGGLRIALPRLESSPETSQELRSFCKICASNHRSIE